MAFPAKLSARRSARAESHAGRSCTTTSLSKHLLGIFYAFISRRDAVLNAVALRNCWTLFQHSEGPVLLDASPLEFSLDGATVKDVTFIIYSVAAARHFAYAQGVRCFQWSSPCSLRRCEKHEPCIDEKENNIDCALIYKVTIPGMCGYIHTQHAGRGRLLISRASFPNLSSTAFL